MPGGDFMALESMELKVTDNSRQALEIVQQLAITALEVIGTQAEAYAKLTVTDAMRDGIDLRQYGEKNNSRVDTGALRNSITHAVDGSAVYIGSNLEHAVWNELGTGLYASQPGGRKGWWVYIEGQKSRGRAQSKTYATRQEAMKVVAILRKKGLKAHATCGMYPLHFLKNAAANHTDEYRAIFEDIMKKGK